MRIAQCVDIKDKEERQKFIDSLESKGYIVDETRFSRNDIICGRFPIIVNLESKKIDMMGNTTVSAAAASSGILVTQEEFEKLINDKK